MLRFKVGDIVKISTDEHKLIIPKGEKVEILAVDEESLTPYFVQSLQGDIKLEVCNHNLQFI